MTWNKEKKTTYAREWQKNNPDRTKHYTRPGTPTWATRRLLQAISIAEKQGYQPPDITRDQLVKLYDNHTHCCDVCGLDVLGNGREMALDHNHETGEVRGWLCVGCNISRVPAFEQYGEELARYLKK